LYRRLATLGAAFIPLHPQLVLPLPGDWQVREFVFYALSHSVLQPLHDLKSKLLKKPIVNL
jgi:hypothetical protein